MKTVHGSMVLLVGLTLLGTGGFSPAWAASDYPNRPVEMVVTFSPGGGADIASRAYKDFAAKHFGQPILSVFKLGAGGATGTAYVAQSKPDGYATVVMSTSSLVTTPLVKKVGYTMEDFTPICNFSTLPLVWAVKDDSPYKTMPDFIRAAKAKKMKYASYGALTQGNICTEALAKTAGVQFIHIPYDGGAKAMAAVMGGHADIAVAAGATGMAGPGKLRILATGGKGRVETFSDVPTLKESGYPVYGNACYSLWAPKGTPKEIVNKLFEAFKKAAEENGKEIGEILRGLEHAFQFMAPEETLKLYQEDYAFQREWIEAMGKLAK
jgi:tripartite-type tricarboxylate transporter receptor subunit TctC